MITKKNRAFTLIETSLVLLIVSVTLLLGVFPVKKTMAKNQEKMFYQSFRNDVTYITSVAIKANRPSWITFKPSKTQQAIFTCGHIEKRLPLPKTVVLDENYTVDCYVSNKGSVPPITIRYHSLLTHHNYRLVFQLGFGAQYRIYED